VTPDPILTAAIREFRARMKRREDAGMPASEELQEKFFRKATGGKYGLADARQFIDGIDTGINPRNLARSAVQGLTLNFADDLVGMVNPAAGQEMKLRDELFGQQHPVADAAAGFAGGMVLPGAMGVRAFKAGSGIMGATRTGAAIGGISGGLAGIGAGETVEQRAAGAAMGAAGGMAFGAAVPFVAGGIGAAFSPTQRAQRRLMSAVEGSGGAQALEGRVADFELADRGNEVMLGDLSNRMRNELDFTANANVDEFTQTATQLAERQRNAQGRLLNDTRTLAGDPVADELQQGLEAARRAWADQAYGALRSKYESIGTDVAQNPEIASALEQLFDQPKVRSAWKAAQEAGLIGKEADMGFPSFQQLQDVKEALDDAANAAFAARRGNLGTRLASARDLLVEKMSELIPEYRPVQAGYAKFKSLERALESGVEAWGMDDTRTLQRVVSEMAPEELKLFREGMASELISRLRSTDKNRGEAERLLNASDAMTDKLKVLFGDEQTFQRFMRRVEAEAEMGKSRRVVGGSATARRQAAEGFDPLDVATLPMNPVGMFGKLMQALPGTMARKTAAELGPVLRTQGAENIRDQLSTMQDAPPMVSPWFQQRVPAAVGGALPFTGR
jgi:hypothetical protein